MRVVGKNIDFRLVEVDDAAFIVNLRASAKNRFLTPVGIEEQVEYLRKYKKKEGKGEFYFIVCDKTGRAVGTVRVYDFLNGSFCWGSWLLGAAAPASAGIESALLVYLFAFEYLDYRHCHFDVRVENTKVRNFHERFGASVVKADDSDVYYELSRSSFLKIRERYAKFLPPTLQVLPSAI